MKVRFHFLKGKISELVDFMFKSEYTAFNIQNSHRLQFPDFRSMSHRTLKSKKTQGRRVHALGDLALLSLSIHSISFPPGIHDPAGLSGKAYYCAEYPPCWVCGWSEVWIRFTWCSCIFDGASSDVFLNFFLAVFCPVVPAFNLFDCNVARADLKLALFLLRLPKCWP